MKFTLLVILLVVMAWRGLKADDPSPTPVKKTGYVVVWINSSEKPEVLECTSGLTAMTALGSIEMPAFHPFRKIRLLRGKEIIDIDLKALRGHPADDPELKPGDILQVPGGSSGIHF